jgi:electron transport complex protein RnfC
VAKKVLPGVHPSNAKNTTHLAPVRMATPAQVVIPMSQHIGAPCQPVVNVGDSVKVGQLIGEATGRVAAPIHASVSGKVTAVDKITLPSGNISVTVTIAADGEQTPYEGITPPTVTDYDSFIEAVRASGAVGLGGAGFPTSIKLCPPDLSAVDTLVVNGAECEPYITSDYQIMMHHSEYVLAGIAAVRKYLELSRVEMGVEEHNSDIIAHYKNLTADDPAFTVHTLKCLYPKGAEKVLIYETLGRVVEEGKLPFDVGCIVMNVGTLAFIGSYLATGMPLVEKVVTVDGSAIREPKTLIVPVGTKAGDIAAAAGGYKAELGKIISGGPMMGIALKSEDMPLLKSNNALLFLDVEEATPPPTTSCIRCGRCVRVCPVYLMPLNLERAYNLGLVDELEKLKVNLCIECGCCSYICPTRRPLVATHRLSKQLLRESKK